MLLCQLGGRDKSLHPANFNFRLTKKYHISDLGFRLCFNNEVREKLQYVSCACELILLFYIVFCLVIDGHKFEFGLVVN